MTYVLTAAEMRDADAEASTAVSVVELMQRAGAAIAAFLQDRTRDGAIVAFAGPGNNGGDAYAALAQLPNRAPRFIYGMHDVAGSAARTDAMTKARDAGVVFRPLPADDAAAREAVRDASWCLDALFGTGAHEPLDACFAPAVRVLDARERRVLAIDVPSPGVRATATVTMAALKSELVLDSGREYAGEIWVAAIGITDEILRAHAHTFATLDADAFLDLLPQRARDSDKRESGAPLVLAGSSQFPGAAVLCALGAARAGAGYVTLAAPADAAPAIRSHLIEQVVVTYEQRPAESVAETLLDVAKRNTSVAIGPGLGLDQWTGAMMRHFIRHCDLPMVIDASGLFHLSKNLDMLRGKRCVLTPHAGEFARLSGKGTIAPGARVERLREFVSRTGIVTLLKGTDTLIDDGQRVYVNPTGTSALGTAGTGDVLTGIISTLLSQHLDVVAAAAAGAYWHGLAGQTAARRRSVGVIARDVTDALADALPERRGRGLLLRYA
jgi:ADP-dependent NAD(P)H-hydrate dehydratase / NAD(P)H-hydrate epimerase